MNDVLKIVLELCVPAFVAICIVFLQDYKKNMASQNADHRRDKIEIVKVKEQLETVKGTQDLILSALHRIEDRLDDFNGRIVRVETKLDP